MSQRPRILLLAETGFIIRNLLLGYFAQEMLKTHDLVVAVQDPDDPELLKAVPQEGVSFIYFPMEPYAGAHAGFIGKYLSWHNWMYGFRSALRANQSMKIQTRLFEAGLPAWIKLLNQIPYWCGKLIKWGRMDTVVEDWYLNHLKETPYGLQWIQLLKEIQPAAVFAGMLTHSTRYRCSSDLPVIVAANKLNIPVCTLVQSWDNLSSKTSVLPPWVKYYYAWSEDMKQELLSLNRRIKPEQVVVTGSPQYDFHQDQSLLENRDQFLHKMNLNPSRPYLLVGTGTAVWMPDEPAKMVQLAARIHRELPELQVLIRLHPKDHGQRWEPWKQQLQELGVSMQYSSPETRHMDEGGFVPPADFYKEQLNAIYHSAVVLNSSSSLTIDAALLDRPVICIAYDIGKDPVFPEGRALAYSRSVHYSKLVQTDGVSLAYSEDGCINAIRQYLEQPVTDKQERKAMVAKVADMQTEKAGVRLAQAIQSWLN